MLDVCLGLRKAWKAAYGCLSPPGGDIVHSTASSASQQLFHKHLQSLSHGKPLQELSIFFACLSMLRHKQSLRCCHLPDGKLLILRMETPRSRDNERAGTHVRNPTECVCVWERESVCVNVHVGGCVYVSSIIRHIYLHVHVFVFLHVFLLVISS